MGVSFLGRRIADRYLAPRQETVATRRMTARVPMEDMHNAFWGVENRQAPTPAAYAVRTQGAGQMDAAQSSSAEAASAMRPPQLVHSEPSELRVRPTSDNPSGEMGLVGLELSEFDPVIQDHIYYHSIHYVGASGATSSSSISSSSSKDTHASKGTTATTAAAAEGMEGSYPDYMPARGEGLIYGMMMCKAVTAQNNCVSCAGGLGTVAARKLLLTFGPVHFLHDSARTFMPLRFSFVKQAPARTLIWGLHSGELPTWLRRAYPNFPVDVVEPDGALVRLCRRFMGFQESSNLHLLVADPMAYLRQLAAPAAKEDGIVCDSGARDDLVLIDAVDGARRLPTQFGRLEFLHNVRNSMSNNGCVAVALPNRDATFVFRMVQTWRMDFGDRMVLRAHCATTLCTILVTFQDNATRGKANMGSAANVAEFQNLLCARTSRTMARRARPLKPDAEGEWGEKLSFCSPASAASRRIFSRVGTRRCCSCSSSRSASPRRRAGASGCGRGRAFPSRRSSGRSYATIHREIYMEEVREV